MASPPAKRFCGFGSSEIDPDPVLTCSEDNPVTADKMMEYNPMLNPVVLKHFFGVCNLEDLRRFRLVCPLWRDVSLERWREDMIVHIAFDEYFEHRKDTNKRQRLHWKEAKILYETPSIVAKPFRRFRLCNWQFPEVKPVVDRLFKLECRQILNQFWINCGHWMKELHLKETKIESTGSFVEVVTKFVPNIVLLNLDEMFELNLTKMEDLGTVNSQLKLKSLKINFSAYDENGDEIDIPHDVPPMTSDTWLGLFVTFPNLQELQWKNFDDVHCRNLMLAWNILLGDERHAGRKLKIKCYDINVYGDDEFDEVDPIDTLNSFFEHPDFAFNHIEIYVNLSEQEEVRSRALSNHRNTLQTLHVSTMTCNLTDIFQIPQLLSTAKLNVSATTDFHFLKNLPKLEHLEIVGYRDCEAETTRSEEIESFQLHQLSKLEFSYDLPHTTPHEICDYKIAVEIFVKCMPNLTVLKCPLSNEIFRIVCQHWRGLKVIDEPTQSEGTLDDEGITGIVPGADSRFPNITLLKYLREFGANCTPSDMSVYHGFLQLDHLTDLDIRRDYLSGEAESVLSSKFGSQILHASKRSYGTCYYSDGDIGDLHEAVVNCRLKMEIFSRDYGIILNNEVNLYGHTSE